MAEHCGTHIYCPYHFDPDGATVDQVKLENLVLPGHLLDLTHKKASEPITIADVEEAVKKSGKPIESGTVVIFWTGVDKIWSQEGFKTNRPHIPADTAQYLVDKKVTLFGTDLIGMDNPDEWWEPTHVAFLKGGLPMVQQLCNLDQLAGKEFIFVVLPMKMRGGTGSPVRPIALVV
jgi:kynurenine formamidase